MPHQSDDPANPKVIEKKTQIFGKLFTNKKKQGYLQVMCKWVCVCKCKCVIEIEIEIRNVLQCDIGIVECIGNVYKMIFPGPSWIVALAQCQSQ